MKTKSEIEVAIVEAENVKKELLQRKNKEIFKKRRRALIAQIYIADGRIGALRWLLAENKTPTFVGAVKKG
jgi:tRNA(Glu) U13 pseudouridine synthase TruD